MSHSSRVSKSDRATGSDPGRSSKGTRATSNDMNPIAARSDYFLEIEMGERTSAPIFLDPKAPPPAPKPLPPWLEGVFVAVGIRPMSRKRKWLSKCYMYGIRAYLLWTYWYLYTIHIFLIIFRPSDSVLTGCEEGTGQYSCVSALSIALTPVLVAMSGSVAYWFLWSIARMPLGFARNYEDRIRPRIDPWTKWCLLFWFVPGTIFAIMWPWATATSIEEENADAERTYHYAANSTLTWDDDKIPLRKEINHVFISTMLSFGCFIGLLPVCAFVVIFAGEVMRLKLMVRDLLLYLSRQAFDQKIWLEAYGRVADEWESMQQRLGYTFGLYTLFVGAAVADMTLVLYYARRDAFTQAIVWPLYCTMIPSFAVLMHKMGDANIEADFVDDKVRALLADPGISFQNALRILYVTERRQLELTLFGRKIRPSDLPNALATLVLAQVAAYLGIGAD